MIMMWKKEEEEEEPVVVVVSWWQWRQLTYHVPSTVLRFCINLLRWMVSPPVFRRGSGGMKCLSNQHGTVLDLQTQAMWFQGFLPVSTMTSQKILYSHNSPLEMCKKEGSVPLKGKESEKILIQISDAGLADLVLAFHTRSLISFSIFIMEHVLLA